MQKMKFILLCSAAALLLIGLAGCSTESASDAPLSPETAVTPSGDHVTLRMDEATLSSAETPMETSLICCLSPVIYCAGSTDSSLTVQICARTTGAPGGIVLQIVPRPVGPICRDVAFPAAGVATYTIGVPLPPNVCLTVTLTGVPCDSGFAFRAFAVNQYGWQPSAEQYRLLPHGGV